MTNLTGKYYNGVTPIGIPGEITLDKFKVIFTDGETSEQYLVSDITVSPRIGSAPRFINLPNGSQFECDDHAALDLLPQESPTEDAVAWLEIKWPVALASVIVVFCLLVTGYFFGLPAAAKPIAEHIPLESEQSLGKYVIDWLDDNNFFKHSNLEYEIQDELTAGFERLNSNLPFQKYYTLEFRSGSMGPNAFALPGGIIILTDEMVNISKSNEEIFAVLAHEIGHTEKRHAMRSMLQGSIVAIAVASVTGDATSLNAGVTGLPMLLARTRYSREFETEADDFCFKLLKQNGYSPNAFASLMERVAKKNGEKKNSFAYISTHPSTYERIQRARDAAGK